MQYNYYITNLNKYVHLQALLIRLVVVTLVTNSRIHNYH